LRRAQLKLRFPAPGPHRPEHGDPHQRPVANQSAANQSAANQAVVNQSAVNQSAVNQAVVGKPVVGSHGRHLPAGCTGI
jgi:hypothetical protein